MASPYLIEVSSEAGRKVGGIYTVLLSKSRFISEQYKGKYLLVGMYDERCAQDIKSEPPPSDFQKIFKELSATGIICHWGKWTYAGDLPIISVDAKTFAEQFTSWEDGKRHADKQVNYAKHLLWQHFGIDSLMEASYDFSENVAWGWAVGMLIEKMCRDDICKGPAVAQFHEWIAGSALLYCKMKKLPVATVFTTHATVLGRTLASGGVDVLAAARASGGPIELSESYRVKVEGKHQLEMQAAKNAEIFTTVSETVGEEVRYILNRKPDIITLNGLDFEQAEKEAEVRHLSKYARGELLQLAEACFMPYYPQSYRGALFTFISGRHEFTNKGFDIYISAMGKLNQRLKGQKNERRVFAFIFAPTSVKGPKISIIRNYLLLDKIQEVLQQMGSMDEGIYTNLQDRIKRLSGPIRNDVETMAKGFVKDGERPHINLFDLSYGSDEIIRACVSAGLTNAKEDPVKVLFYPTYLGPNDGLLNLGYYDVISGMDVGIFPSRYEPFGYTPLEAGLKMDIAVSGDTTGFGHYLKHRCSPKQCKGVKILSMAGNSTDAISGELADYLESLYNMDPKEFEGLKEEAYRTMKLFDWKLLVKNYFRAYDAALKKKADGKRKN